jgi:DUF4097 and DUF4098 domain-containing protein YvlB
VTASRIFLLATILAGGAGVETAYQFREHMGVGPFGWRLFGGKFYGPHFLYEESSISALDPGVAVAIENEFGDVAVTAGEPGKVEVRLRKDVYVADEQKARALADRIKLEVDRGDGRLRLRTNRRELEGERDTYEVGFETHFDVRVPPGTAVEVSGSHGRASVEDAGDTHVQVENGEASARRVGGVRFEVSHGAATIEGARGDVRLEVRHGDVVLRDASGAANDVIAEHGSVTIERVKALRVELRFGDLRAESVDGALQVRGEHAGVEARKIAQGADVETTSGGVRLEDVGGDVRLKVEHGETHVLRVKGAVSADTSYADTRLEEVDGRAEVRVVHGGLRGKALRGGLVAKTDGDDINVDGFRGAVEAEAERGSVRLAPDGAIRDAIVATASFGNVRLRVPDGSGVEIAAESENGDIDVSVPGFDAQEKSDSRVRGRVGAGGVLVSLRASHGDVRVSDTVAGKERRADDEDE